jgi:hypothetical protein
LLFFDGADPSDAVWAGISLWAKERTDTHPLVDLPSLREREQAKITDGTCTSSTVKTKLKSIGTSKEK